MLNKSKIMLNQLNAAKRSYMGTNPRLMAFRQAQ